MIKDDDLEKILTIYFEEVYQTKDREKITKYFSIKYSPHSFKLELERLNSSIGITDIVMGGGMFTLYSNPDRKILIFNGAEIGTAIWTNKPSDRITKFDKEIKQRIEKRWAEMGYKILECS